VSVDERIVAARAKLDAIGDCANEIIAAFEARLSELRPGVGVTMPMDVDGVQWSVSYARSSDKGWRLYAKNEHSIEVTLCSAPRLVRLMFIEQTDAFMEQLATRMEDIIARHSTRTSPLVPDASVSARTDGEKNGDQ
jgi:hypothetical protein